MVYLGRNRDWACIGIMGPGIVLVAFLFALSAPSVTGQVIPNLCPTLGNNRFLVERCGSSVEEALEVASRAETAKRPATCGKLQCIYSFYEGLRCDDTLYPSKLVTLKEDLDRCESQTIFSNCSALQWEDGMSCVKNYCGTGEKSCTTQCLGGSLNCFMRVGCHPLSWEDFCTGMSSHFRVDCSSRSGACSEALQAVAAMSPASPMSGPNTVVVVVGVLAGVLLISVVAGSGAYCYLSSRKNKVQEIDSEDEEEKKEKNARLATERGRRKADKTKDAATERRQEQTAVDFTVQEPAAVPEAPADQLRATPTKPPRPPSVTHARVLSDGSATRSNVSIRSPDSARSPAIYRVDSTTSRQSLPGEGEGPILSAEEPTMARPKKEKKGKRKGKKKKKKPVDHQDEESPAMPQQFHEGGVIATGDAETGHIPTLYERRMPSFNNFTIDIDVNDVISDPQEEPILSPHDPEMSFGPGGGQPLAGNTPTKRLLKVLNEVQSTTQPDAIITGGDENTLGLSLASLGDLETTSLATMSEGSSMFINNRGYDRRRSNVIKDQVKRAHWQRGQLLGQGSSGNVYLGVLRDGSMLAVKTITTAGMDDHDIQGLARELALIGKLKHSNVVRYFCAKVNEQQSTLDVWMEYVSGGSLGALARGLGSQLEELVVQQYMRQVVAAIVYLHSRGVMHRDIKGDNLLVDGRGTVKVADFGCAKRFIPTIHEEGSDGSPRAQKVKATPSGGMMAHSTATMVGTPLWMAPEVINPPAGSTGYTTKADIWALGITTAELLSKGVAPWPEFSSPWDAMYKIGGGMAPTLDTLKTQVSHECISFISMCTKRNPDDRPTAVDLQTHPWLVPTLD